jgi:hypothetical protein
MLAKRKVVVCMTGNSRVDVFVDSGKWLQLKLVGDFLPALGSHTMVAVDNTIFLYGGSSDFNRSVGHCTRYYRDMYTIRPGE